MAEKYYGFKDLPQEVVERLKKQIIDGEGLERTVRTPEYTKEQLNAIVDAFTLFNNAVKKGLPNQLYQMFAKVFDTVLAQRAFAKNAIWYAHEGSELAKEVVQEFADRLKFEIDEREDWDGERFHREYFLSKEDEKLEEKGE